MTFGVVAAVAIAASDEARAAQCGRAAWFDLTGLTASGERADSSTLTAAHRSLPFQSRVRVENLSNGRAVTVRINDRGPFTKGRVIDVSKAAAQQLGFIKAGTARVRVTVIDGDRGQLPTNCEDGKSAAVDVVALAKVVPPPRPRPIEAMGDAQVDDIGVEPVSGDITQRFDDAFAPDAEELTLIEPLLELTDSTPEIRRLDPHHGVAPREEWDQLQGLPN